MTPLHFIELNKPAATRCTPHGLCRCSFFSRFPILFYTYLPANSTTPTQCPPRTVANSTTHTQCVLIILFKCHSRILALMLSESIWVARRQVYWPHASRLVARVDDPPAISIYVLHLGAHCSCCCCCCGCGHEVYTPWPVQLQLLLLCPWVSAQQKERG